MSHKRGPIRSVLVANRGEVATRILTTLRRLGVETVAICSEADREAPYICLAGRCHVIGPAPLLESYLHLERVMDAVRESGVDAVHPGYGLLSEKAEFARSLEDAGVRSIGPGSLALARLGNKLEARRLAKEAGMSPPPGSDAALSLDDLDGVVARARTLGYPLLIKAAGGGGGIGIQVAHDEAELRELAPKAELRAYRAFGVKGVFLERLLDRPRHIELQLLRDADGHTVVLGDRECSVQRRYQKLIEECPAPCPILDRSQIEGPLAKAAARLLDSVDYVGIATLELLCDSDGSLFFLEVNPRLQVEHGTTEQVFGVDLVELQLRLAEGQPLPAELSARTPRGHSIEVRLCAEDPARGFLPQPGRVTALQWPEGEGLRIDAGIELGSEISPYYDPLFAKLLGYGRTREEARQRLVAALRGLELELTSARGPRVTNQQFLLQLLESRPFVAGDYHTGLVELLKGTTGL